MNKLSGSADNGLDTRLGPRLADLSWEAAGMGLLAATIGFTSTFAVVLQSLRISGASEQQATSALVVLTIGMGVSGLLLALRYRMPIGAAWSTPGAALLISSGSILGSFNEAIGAFIVSAVLTIIAGWIRPLGRLIESIPSSLANAMLAGVLLNICLSPVRAVATDFWMAAPLLLTWWLVGRFNRLFAVPAALLVLVPVVALTLGFPDDLAQQLGSSVVPHVIWVQPAFELQTVFSIGIPLFIVTMASQNVPGIAVLRANGFDTKAGPLIFNTGLFSLLTAPFGALGINLAAVTAALFCSTDAHADPQRRYWSAAIAGVAYIFMGLFAGVAVMLISLVPSILVEAIAGLALLGSFTAAIAAALADVKHREATAITFLFAGSGLAFMGIGGAFWGLLIGSAMYAVTQWQSKR